MAKIDEAFEKYKLAHSEYCLTREATAVAAEKVAKANEVFSVRMKDEHEAFAKMDTAWTVLQRNKHPPEYDRTTPLKFPEIVEEEKIS